ncbi:ATP phosphoribosyltransferase regulatory subunit [Reinekea blandensis]|uniref:ATP phosphoribosyltransferase regulatory subunit n=1 Tax=Reinekea blandensis MED297 TaxID=314283 RepID=A4BEB8_9GAMM|nr:ATP phosphoribosyltransferase regulatory subunit [Reinekea blandensis]EAR09596.1 tRNA synthetase, class II (G, H, P and S) [Reinekea blandensis MED297]
MTIADRWQLPDGIEEILPPQAARIEALRRSLLDEYRAWGYDLLQPPMAEYLESLLTGVGHDLDLLTFKITDQQTGRMMGVSADRTQQVARMDAHSMPKAGVARYCYCDPVLHTRATHLLSSRSPIQIGAELYGYGGIESEVEIVALMLRSLEKAGLEDITLDLGHVAIYHALVNETTLNAEQRAELYSLLRQRALPELSAWLNASDLSPQMRDVFRKLPSMAGSLKQLADWQQQLSSVTDQVTDALTTLRTIAEQIEQRYPSVRVHLDLAELRDFNYHSGLVFSAFVPGFGQPVARGGRYDHTGEVFGRSRPATGFSSDLKVLASQTVAQWGESPGILVPANPDAALQAVVEQLRARGERVIQLFSDQDHVDELGCDRVLVQDGDQWVVKQISDKQAQ